jgi:hypothetical protein
MRSRRLTLESQMHIQMIQSTRSEMARVLTECLQSRSRRHKQRRLTLRRKCRLAPTDGSRSSGVFANDETTYAKAIIIVFA